MDIDPRQLRIDTFRTFPSRISAPDNAVRITYLPTGHMIEVSSERSLHKNKNIAFERMKVYIQGLTSKAITLGGALAIPGAYVISVNGENIGASMRRENVSKDNDHFIGVDNIIEFVHAPTFVEDYYTFDVNSLLYISPCLTPFTYICEMVDGSKCKIQIAICESIYGNLMASSLDNVVKEDRTLTLPNGVVLGS